MDWSEEREYENTHRKLARLAGNSKNLASELLIQNLIEYGDQRFGETFRQGGFLTSQDHELIDGCYEGRAVGVYLRGGIKLPDSIRIRALHTLIGHYSTF